MLAGGHHGAGDFCMYFNRPIPSKIPLSSTACPRLPSRLSLPEGKTADSRPAQVNALGMDFPSKFTVRISWDDQFKKQNSKDIEIVS